MGQKRHEQQPDRHVSVLALINQRPPTTSKPRIERYDFRLKTARLNSSKSFMTDEGTTPMNNGEMSMLAHLSLNIY